MKRTLVFVSLAVLGLSAIAANPKVKVSTSKGDIVVELYPDLAPVSVENFVRYVNDKHYSGTVFHRVIGGFMIQGGGLDENLVEKVARSPVVSESKNGLSNSRGTIAMARTSNPNSAQSQFFINLVDNSALDYNSSNPGYTVFGKVVEGMGVVDAIGAVATQRSGMHANVPVEVVKIASADLLNPGAYDATQYSPSRELQPIVALTGSSSQDSSAVGSSQNSTSERRRNSDDATQQLIGALGNALIVAATSQGRNVPQSQITQPRSSYTPPVQSNTHSNATPQVAAAGGSYGAGNQQQQSSAQRKNYRSAAGCVSFQTAHGNYINRVHNGCSFPVLVKWCQAQGCGAEFGTGGLKPGSTASISPIKGRYEYVACEYPGSPRNASGSSWTGGRQYSCD